MAREPSNATDKLAVAVMKNGDVVGHVPYNLAPALSQEASNKAVVEVTGDRVNRGSGYGLDVPCIYRVYGLKLTLTKSEKFYRTYTLTNCASLVPRPRPLVGGAGSWVYCT